MDKAHQSILNIYRLRLKHYDEIGIGNNSKITGTIVTKKMIATCLERYMELGGNISSLGVNDEIYREFIKEVSELS